MEPKAHYMIVGAVVIFLTVGIISAVLWLSNRGAANNITPYIVYFREQSLDGLQVDSNVTMKGIKVGHVASFNISPKNIETVRVLVRLNSDTPIKTDTRAVIRRNLLTGLAYIDLTDSSQQSPLLTEVPPGEDAPVIPEGVSELRQFTQSVPTLLEQTGIILHRTQLFLSEENAKKVTEILSNVSHFTGELAEHDKEIGRLIDDFTRIAANFRSVSAALARATEEGKIDALSEDLRHAAAEISHVVASLDQRIETVVRTIIRATDEIVAQTGRFTREGARAARDFSALAEAFHEPRSALLGPTPAALGPGEERANPQEAR